jgi:serine/threonine-protein phosphatase PGAM5
MAKRHLYIVRHGQYEAQPTQPDEPSDGPLTTMGQEQARITAQRLHEFPIHVIHYSPLQRATETAHVIAAQFPDVPLQSSDLLRECIPTVPPAYEALFTPIPAQFIAQGGPQARQAYATFCAPLAEEATEDRHEIIVSSGNLIKYLACHALGAPDDAWIQADIQHCGITEIVIGPPFGLVLLRLNDGGHLPAQLRNY